MAEFVCRLGTPGGEIVTRTVEAVAANEVRTRLEREGFKVFAITPPKGDGLASFTKGGGTGRGTRVKANDFLLFNQQLAALLRAGIPILRSEERRVGKECRSRSAQQQSEKMTTLTIDGGAWSCPS